MQFPKSLPAELSIYISFPVSKGSEALYLWTGNPSQRDCISGSLIQLKVGFTTRCNWIHAGASTAKNDQGPNLQHAPAGFSGATTAFISVLSDPNKRSELLAKEEGSLILSCCRWIAQARAKGQEAKGEEKELMLKVGAAIA